MQFSALLVQDGITWPIGFYAETEEGAMDFIRTVYPGATCIEVLYRQDIWKPVRFPPVVIGYPYEFVSDFMEDDYFREDQNREEAWE